MSYLFKALASGGKLNILNKVDLEKVCLSFENKEMLIEIREYNRSGAKSKLMAYYHAVILKEASKAFHTNGEPKDEIESDYCLRAMFAKIFVKDIAGNFITTLESKSEMTKDRLLQYVTDCINFLESTFNIEVPNSQEFLALKKHGRAMKEIKAGDKKDNFTQI
jgi:hypothetical protein